MAQHFIKMDLVFPENSAKDFSSLNVPPHDSGFDSAERDVMSDVALEDMDFLQKCAEATFRKELPQFNYHAYDMDQVWLRTGGYTKDLGRFAYFQKPIGCANSYFWGCQNHEGQSLFNEMVVCVQGKVDIIGRKDWVNNFEVPRIEAGQAVVIDWDSIDDTYKDGIRMVHLRGDTICVRVRMAKK